MKKERMMLPVALLQLNEGQLEWMPKNPRQWTQEDIDKTAASIDEDKDFLEERPILVIPIPGTGDFVVFCGNLRREGAKAAGLVKVPCVVHYPETEDDREAVLRRSLKDNGSFGRFDWDEMANSPVWGQFDLASFGIPSWPQPEGGEGGQQGAGGTGGGEAHEDDFDEEKDEVKTRCKSGDIWQLGEHRLMCGDSKDLSQIEQLMDGEKADMIFTDPPYGVTALKWDVKIDLEKMFDNIWSACKKNADILVTGVQPFVTDLINAGRDFFRHEIIWKKTQSTGFFQANHAPLKIHENILVFCKGNGTYNPKKNVIGEGTGRVRHQSANRAAHYHGNHESTYVDDGTRFPTSVIEFSNWNGALFGNVSNAVSHPTQKPVDLVAYLIETYSNKNDSVLDLFGGSGTTLIAAEQLGRKCYMMELDPHYCDIIIARWEKETGKTAIRLD